MQGQDPVNMYEDKSAYIKSTNKCHKDSWQAMTAPEQLQKQ